MQFPDEIRSRFEAAVVERLKESGFQEIEIRMECLARVDDGYQDEIINAGWHYWRAGIATAIAKADALAGWQPIESAPRDGTRILFLSRMFDQIRIGYYKDGHIWTGDLVSEPSSIPREWKDIADFWMPEPAKPAAKIA